MANLFRSKRVGIGVTPSSVGGVLVTVALIASLWGLRRLTPDGSPIFYVGAAGLVLAYCAFAFRSASRRQVDDSTQ